MDSVYIFFQFIFHSMLQSMSWILLSSLVFMEQFFSFGFFIHRSTVRFTPFGSCQRILSIFIFVCSVAVLSYSLDICILYTNRVHGTRPLKMVAFKQKPFSFFSRNEYTMDWCNETRITKQPRKTFYKSKGTENKKIRAKHWVDKIYDVLSLIFFLFLFLFPRSKTLFSAVPNSTDAWRNILKLDIVPLFEEKSTNNKCSVKTIPVEKSRRFWLLMQMLCLWDRISNLYVFHSIFPCEQIGWRNIGFLW